MSMVEYLYLVKIETTTGKVLYIDDTSGVWTEASFNLSGGRIDGPAYFDDFDEAEDCAKLYGGEVAKCIFMMEACS